MATTKTVTAIGPRIKMLNTLVEKELNNTLANLDTPLTGTQMTVLMTINDTQDSVITQKNMESILRLSHPTTRGVIKRLVAMNLISTSKMPNDQRQVVLNMTSQGVDLVKVNRDKINKSVQAVEARIVAGLSTKNQQEFLKVLNKMINNF
ncbi:MarR family winged helix-turn-helix transcriptional regulator [Lactiplantibacillus daowaiensis]|uniref:MarR family winged helix-turn-helix transcriptional regulator n=1 Tax=Lactiplantibacillus daowaiensis TaxID=2559918 RepID=A0ABW1RX17_9LACO|nr:MarR family winged helix-turn-helix transcriptional regulator [Lactiplantibacillus daowaiensis]